MSVTEFLGAAQQKKDSSHTIKEAPSIPFPCIDLLKPQED